MLVRIKLILSSLFNDHLSDISTVHKLIIAVALDRYPFNVTAEMSIWKDVLKKCEYRISKI